MKIEEKLEKIRKIVGETVIFKLGMREPKKYDLLAVEVCYENIEVPQKNKEITQYIG